MGRQKYYLLYFSFRFCLLFPRPFLVWFLWIIGIRVATTYEPFHYTMPKFTQLVPYVVNIANNSFIQNIGFVGMTNQEFHFYGPKIFHYFAVFTHLSILLYSKCITLPCRFVSLGLWASFWTFAIEFIPTAQHLTILKNLNEGYVIASKFWGFALA